MSDNHTTQQLKTCTGCKRELPATAEFFHSGKNYRGGLHSSCKKCRAEHNRKYYASIPGGATAAYNEWRRTNPEKARAKDLRRRALKQGAGGSHTAADIQERLEEQGWMCAYCHEPLGDNYHVDHMVPLCRGGSDNADNLAAACPSCNSSKGTKLLSEWSGRS